MSDQKPYNGHTEQVDDSKHVDETLSDHSKEALGDDPEYSPAEQSKIIHKVDRRLISTCGVLYCISLMDRTNLSAAALAGMTAELRLNVGFRYVSYRIRCQLHMLNESQSTIALVFFITYVLFQPPCTVLCRKLGRYIHDSGCNLTDTRRTSSFPGWNMLRLGGCHGKRTVLDTPLFDTDKP